MYHPKFVRNLKRGSGQEDEGGYHLVSKLRAYNAIKLESSPVNTINEGPSGNEKQKKRGTQRKDAEPAGVEGHTGWVLFSKELPFVGPRYERGNNAPWNVTHAPLRPCVDQRVLDPDARERAPLWYGQRMTLDDDDFLGQPVLRQMDEWGTMLILDISWNVSAARNILQQFLIFLTESIYEL